MLFPDFSRTYLDEFKDVEEPYFRPTSRYKTATEVLEKQNIIILTGHPGEGKTTMACKLALDKSQSRNCLILKNPSDWRRVDWSLKIFDTIIIDDIFGSGSLDQLRLADWKPYLSEIETEAKNKRLKVIITTRHYILEECSEDLDAKLTMFKTANEDGAVVLLTSKDLTVEERGDILQSQADRNDKDIPTREIHDIAKASTDADFYSSQENFAFGFPECASMFVRSKNMYELGTEFFRKPASLFKKYLEDVYHGSNSENTEKFLALVAVWTSDSKHILDKELRNLKTVPPVLKQVVDLYYGADLDFDKLQKIKASLKSHIGDFLEFKENTGEYSFSHNIIGDMVGVVLGKKRADVALELAPRDFLMERISIDEPESKKELKEFMVVVQEREYDELAEKIINMIVRRGCNQSPVIPNFDEFSSLMRHGKRPNTLKVEHTIDFGIINHRAFNDERFVNRFLERANALDVVNDLFLTPVMKLSGYFFDYGIQLESMTLCLTGYALFKRITKLAQKVFLNGILPDTNVDPTSSLLMATHAGGTKTIKFLISHGARVTGDTLYIAIHKTSTKVLETLLVRPDIDVNDAGNIVNGNTPLMVAVKKDKIEAVRLLLEHGADPCLKSNDDLSALHKAVIYRRNDILQLLLDKNPPLDGKGGKFRRTPLHIAADLGDLVATQALLNHGANVKLKDHRRHYPIHLAAIREQCEVVKVLLEHDKSQESLRIVSYGKKSFFKGMSLYHVAAWKNNKKLLNALTESGADPNVRDFYGQTPLFYSIMQGKKKITKQLVDLPSVDKNLSQKQGYTPLHAAVLKGNTQLVKQLGPTVNANKQDKYGRTPLHVACEKGNVEAVVFLMARCRADSRMITKRGDTVYHILRRKQSNSNSDQHLVRRAIERFLKEQDPTLQERVQSLPNKRGVVIKSFYTCLTGDEKLKVRTLLRNAKASAEVIDINEPNDDDESDDEKASGAKASRTSLVDALLSMMALYESDTENLTDGEHLDFDQYDYLDFLDNDSANDYLEYGDF